MLERTLKSVHAQEILFAPKLSRIAILGLDLELDAPDIRQVTINVWRNHNFESIVNIITPYSICHGWKGSFRIGPYDDSLMFADRLDADIELLWLDSTRYFQGDSKLTDRLQWLNSRLLSLREVTPAPIVVATWCESKEVEVALQDLVDHIPFVRFANIAAICDANAVTLIDNRLISLTGTQIGAAAQLVIARELACHWLPALVFSPVKAIAVDLDNTLHSGVLGEDGIEGVQLTAGHISFQRFLLHLRDLGIYIALVSRNVHGDVVAMLSQRKDYPLRWEDFSAIEVSWGDKAEAIQRLCETLLISPNALLFIDDNPGELASVASQTEGVQTVFAHPDAWLTEQAVRFYPGVWRWKFEEDDSIRVKDLQANVARDVVAQSSGSQENYFSSLQVTLEYHFSPKAHLSRLASLCNKTNQFNLALSRFNEAELAKYMNREDASVACIQLTDRLSSSGIVAVLVAERVGESVVVAELCMSCRAMGRRLEDTIFLWALRGMPIFSDCKSISFHVRHGPRNQPALDWIAKLLSVNQTPVAGYHSLSATRVWEFVPPKGINFIEDI